VVVANPGDEMQMMGAIVTLEMAGHSRNLTRRERKTVRWLNSSFPTFAKSKIAKVGHPRACLVRTETC